MEGDKQLKYCMQMLLPPEHFEHVVNLQPIEVEDENLPNDNITSAVDPVKPHAEGSTLPEEIQITN